MRAVGDAAWVRNRIAVAFMVGNFDNWPSLHEVVGLQVLAGAHEAVKLLLEGLEVVNFLLAAGLKDFFDENIDELKALQKTALHTLVLQR